MLQLTLATGATVFVNADQILVIAPGPSNSSSVYFSKEYWLAVTEDPARVRQLWNAAKDK